MREVVIVDGLRSAFGKRGGGLRNFGASELGGYVARELIRKTNVLERVHVDDFMMGSVVPDQKSFSPARYAAQLAKLPFDTSSTFIEMQCGSAINAMNHAAWKILMGLSDVAIVGGAESHSQWLARYSMSNTPYRDQPYTPVDFLAAPFPEQNTNMLQNSDRMAREWEISKEECDEFAYISQHRMGEAIEKGIIGPEIVPCVDPVTGTVITKDEHPRPNITMEQIQKMKPVYEGGVTTAANASGRNDGAAFVLMMTAEKAKEAGYTPIMKWVTGADIGCLPNVMGIAAAYSNLKAMKQAGLRIKDIDVFECNEAFAAQNLSVIKEMQNTLGETIDRDKWNPYGGAIAIGHPNAASGARITLFAMRRFMEVGGKYAVVSSCCGGGLGTTAIFENLLK